MDSEVLVIAKLCEDCVRDGSDTHLETCSVVNKGSAMLSDSDFHFIGFAEMCRLKRFVTFDEYVNHIHRNHGLSPRAWNVWIDYCDHCLCAFYCSECSIDRRSEGYVSVLVRRTHLDHRHIAWECSASVKFLGLAQENRDVVRVACLNTLAHICSHKECLMEEDTVELRVGVWCRTFCVKVMYAYITKFSCLSSCT